MSKRKIPVVEIITVIGLIALLIGLTLAIPAEAHEREHREYRESDRYKGIFNYRLRGEDKIDWSRVDHARYGETGYERKRSRNRIRSSCSGDRHWVLDSNKFGRLGRSRCVSTKK